MIYSAAKKKLIYFEERALLATTRVTSCVSCLYIMICTQQSRNTKCIFLFLSSPFLFPYFLNHPRWNSSFHGGMTALTVMCQRRTARVNEWLCFGHFEDDGDDDEFMTMIISRGIPVCRHRCLSFRWAAGSVSRENVGGMAKRYALLLAKCRLSPLKLQPQKYASR